MCYVKKAILQNPRFTTQVHTKHNQPRYTVYNLNWNKKKQAGLTTSKHSIALSKAASYDIISQTIGHGSLDIRKNKIMNKSKQQQAFIYWKWHGP